MKKLVVKYLVIGVVAFIVGSTLGDIYSERQETKIPVVVSNVKEEQAPIEEKPIEYIPITSQELIDDVEKNAFGAKQNHQNQYYEITGVIRNIDNNGEYISIEPQDNKFRLLTIMCYVPKDMRPNLVNYQIGVEVRVKGKVTDVGEVMGYSVAVDELN